MADEFDSDAAAAEVQFLRRRLPELEAEHREQLKVLGESLGVEVIPDDFTPEMAELFAQKTVEALRQSGNTALADKWFSAWTNLKQTMRALEQLNEQHAETISSPDSLPLTASALHEWNTAREVAKAAQEEFERAISEASGWFDSVDKDGEA